ncbi:MAG: translocation/assembly module TamB domain-containing protein [Candidatus Zixiibacteriota bacterium]
MRWWLKGLLGALIVAIIAAIGVYVYFWRMHGLERLVSTRLSALVGQRYPVAVTIGDIRGDLLHGLVLEDIVIDLVDSASQLPLFSARRLTLTYSIANLWHRNYIFSFVELDSAAVRLESDSAGHWRLPRPHTSASGTANATAPPSIHVDECSVRGASVNVIKDGDTLRFSNITLVASLDVDEGTMSADVKQLSFDSNREPLRITASQGKVTLAGRQLVVRDVSLVTGPTRINLNGITRLGERTAQFEYDINDLSLEEPARLFGVKLSGTVDATGSVVLTDSMISGRVNVGGTLSVARFENLYTEFRFHDKHLVFDTLYGIVFSECGINGSGAIDFTSPDPAYRLDATVHGFDLVQLLPKGFPSDLNGSLRLHGSSFRTDRLRLDIGVELYESMFDYYPLQSARGNLVVTSDSVTFGEWFGITYYENELQVAGSVDYSDSLNLRVLARLDNLDRYTGKLFIKDLGGRGRAEATLTGSTSDPDLGGTFVSDSLRLYDFHTDSCRSTFDIKRFLTRQHGSVVFLGYGGSLWGKQLDSTYATMTMDSGLVTLDAVHLHNPQLAVSTRGRFNYGTYPQTIALDSLVAKLLGRELHNRGLLTAEIDTLGLNITRARLVSTEGELEGTGRINFDESMNLALHAQSIPVRMWGSMVREGFDVDGKAALAIGLAGTFAWPEITLQGTVDSVVYRQLSIGDLQIAATYRDQQVKIDTLQILSHPGHYRATGYFGYQIDLTADTLGHLLDVPISLSIIASDKRFDLVSFVLPSVEQLDGDFFADFRIFGTPTSPHLDGEAYLKNGRLKYFDLADSLYTDSAGVTMKDNQVIIDKIEAYVKDKRRGGQKAYAVIDGIITVEALDRLYYDVDVSLPRPFPYTYELEDIQGVVAGNVHVEGESPPQVTGDITILSTRYRAEFASEEAGSPLMSLLAGENTWDVDVNIDILSNYWIKNQDIDAEFSGTINLIRESGAYRFIGEMEILRGKGFLFDKTFRIENGSRVIFDDIAKLNPTLDITACTRIPGVNRPNDESREPIDLCLHITGTLETPEFNTLSEGLSREDIVPLLLANYSSSDTASAGGLSQVEERLTGLVSAQVSQLGTRQLSRLGVETFEIDPTYNRGQLDPLKSQVTLGFYTAPSLYVYGRSALSGGTGQEVGFEYRLNRSVRIEGLRDEDELYHLSLNWHLEF